MGLTLSRSKITGKTKQTGSSDQARTRKIQLGEMQQPGAAAPQRAPRSMLQRAEDFREGNPDATMGQAWKAAWDDLKGHTEDVWKKAADNVDAGAGRLGYGLGSIGTSMAATVPLLGETAVQAAKDTVSNLKNKGYRELMGQAQVLRSMMEELDEEDPAYLAAAEEYNRLSKQMEEMEVSAPLSGDSLGMRMMGKANEMQQKATEGLGYVGSFLGNTAISIGQNAALIPTAAINPAVPLVAMGAQSAARKAYEVQSEGGGAGEALARGIVSGGIEAATEKIPLDTLMDLIKGGGKGVLKSLFKQAGVEATEEGLSYAANYIADKAAGDPNAAFSVWELLESAAAGGFSGLFFGGVGTAVNHVQQSKTDKSYRGDGQDQLGREAVDAEQAAPQEAEAILAQLAREMAQQERSAEMGEDAAPVRNAAQVTNREAERVLSSPGGAEQLGIDTNGMTRSQQRAAVKQALAAQRSESQTQTDETQPAVDTAHRITQVRQAATVLGETGSRVLADAYTEKLAREYAPEEVVDGFYTAYNAAAEAKQLTGEQAARVNALPAELKGLAESAGLEDARRAKQAVYFGKDAMLVRDDNFKKANLSYRTASILDAAAKAAGVQVRFAPQVKNGEANAAYENGVITIALDSSDPVLTAFTHEIVHRIRETSPQSYTALASFVRNHISGNTTSALARQYARRYSTDNLSDITEEMVADAFGTILRDGDALAQFVKDDRTAAQKVLDAVRDLISAIKRALSGQNVTLSREQKTAFRELQSQMEGMEKALVDALNAVPEGNENAAREGGAKPMGTLQAVVDSDTMGATRYSLKEDLENGRARKEAREDFKRRCHAEGYSVYEGTGTAYGYRTVHLQSAQQNARQVQEEIKKLGIDADIVDGSFLWNRNDITGVRPVPEAATIERARVLISNGVTLAPRNVAGHEAFHRWKNGVGRGKFIEALEDNLLFTNEEFRYYQSVVAETYLGREADLADPKQEAKFMEELFACISGDIHEGVNDEYLRPMFRDFDTVKAAWNELAQKNTAREGGRERYSLKDQIAVGMSEEERFERLNGRKITVALYDAQRMETIERSDYNALEQIGRGGAFKILRKIGEQFGVFKEYRNADIEIDFGFSKGNLRESVNKQGEKYQNFAKMLSAFDAVVENAVGIEAHRERYQNPDSNVREVYVFLGAVQTETGVLPVRLEVKAFSDGTPSTLHVAVSLTEIERSRIIEATPTGQADEPTSLPASSTINIADILRNVNAKDGALLKYIPDDFLNAEQIEAKQAALDEQVEYIARKNASRTNGDPSERDYSLKSKSSDWSESADAARQAVKDAQLAGMMNQGRKDAVKARKAREASTAAVQKREEAIKALKQHQRDKEAKLRQSRNAAALRDKIQRHVDELSRKLRSPTDKKHIPEPLRGPVALLLESINLESKGGDPTKRTQAFQELKKVYETIRENEELVIDPDLLGGEGAVGLLDEVAGYKDLRIAEMSTEQLQTVWQAIRAIEASIRNANRMLAESRFKTVREAADAIRNDNLLKKSKTEWNYINKLQKLVSVDMLTPEAFFHRLGSSGDALFRMLRSAQDKHIRLMKQAADFTGESLKDVNVRELEREMHTVTLGGREVELSTAQIMELQALMGRAQAREHILKGGILPDVVSKKGAKKAAVAEPIHGITPDEISGAIGVLTPEQADIAQLLQTYASTRMSEWGNEASMEVYGYEKFNEENYWPIRSNRQEVKSDIQKDSQVTTVANRGFTRPVTPHASNSVMLGSIFDTFSTHASEMATYAAWLGASEDINRIRNFVFRDGEGNTVGTVKGVLDRVHGVNKGQQYLAKLLADIANGVKGTHAESNLFNSFVGNYKAASVGANLRVIVQQPTAILRAFEMISPKYFTAASPAKGFETAMKYAPIAQWKDWGYFDIHTGRQMKDVLFDSASKLDKVKEAAMWGAGKMDSISWGLLWNAVEAETKDRHTDLSPGSKEFYEAAAARFNEIIDHTQVVDGILQRSQIMRNPDGISKMTTSFMGEPTKQYNMLLSAIYDAQNGKAGGKRAVARTTSALLFSVLVNAALQSVMDAIRDDDREKEYWEKWLAQFAGIGSEEDGFLDSNLGSSINPLTYLPFVKDLWSVMQGYDVSRMDVDALDRTVSAVSNMRKALNGEGKMTISGAAVNLASEAGRLWGIPVANLKRDVLGALNTAAIGTDNYLMQYRMDSFLYSQKGNAASFLDILYSASVNDPDAYQIIYADMVKKDQLKTETQTTQQRIANGMESRMKKAQGVGSVKDLEARFLTPDQTESYEQLHGRVAGSAVWRSADENQREALEANLYDLIVGNSDGLKMQEKIDAGAAYGIDETDYLLYKLALSMVDEPTESGKLGTYTNDEVEAAIEMLGLNDEASSYLWVAQGKSEKSSPYK